jgi:hypothetical protein
VRSSHAPMVQASGRRWLGCMVLTWDYANESYPAALH